MSLPTPAQGEPEVPPASTPVEAPVDVVEAPVETPHTPVALETEAKPPPNTPVVSDTPHPVCRKQETLNKIAKIIEDLQSLHADLKDHS